MKKFITLVLAVILTFSLSACGDKPFTTNSDITVYSREDGSGTRSAFVELFKIEKKNSSGEKVDYTVNYADITNSTQVMLTSVSQNKSAIGYVSLGALSSDVKALKIDNALPSAENIKNGSYKIYRPFYIATQKDSSQVTLDFISFILSAEGQEIVQKKGYIQIEEKQEYLGEKPSGKIVVAGSSSITPVMEKLIEAYKEINPNATIELQQSDSTTGMNSVIEGVADIGMASREIKSSELEKGLVGKVIALDGIAVIVNLENTIDGLSIDDVMKIYVGEIKKWSELVK